MRRPKGVAALSSYYFGSAVVLVPLVFLVARKGDIDPFSQTTLLFISPVLIVLSVGLWKMKNWARVSAALLTAVGLVAGVVSRARHGFFLYDFGLWSLADLALDLVVLLLNLWILIYLLSPRTRRAFSSSVGNV